MYTVRILVAYKNPVFVEIEALYEVLYTHGLKFVVL